MRARITGTGSYAPGKILSNADLEKMVATSDEWVTERTGIKARRVGPHGHVRIEARDHIGGARDLRTADRLGRMDDLALQVRQRDGVVVDHAERADPGGSEVKQCRAAEPPGPDHQHTSRFQGRLAGAADLADHDVARVTLQFFSRQHDPSMNRARSVADKLDVLKVCPHNPTARLS